MYRVFISVILIVISASCQNSTENRYLDIQSVDTLLINRVELIKSDYLKYAPLQDSINILAKKSYMSDAARLAFITHYTSYNYSPSIFNKLLGSIQQISLTQIERRKVVTRFKYDLQSSLQKETVNLWFDINEDYRLSKIHLFLILTGQKEKTNIYSGSYIRF